MHSSRWLAVLLVSGSVGLLGCERPSPGSTPASRTEVVITRATAGEVTDYEEFTGHTDAILSVQIRARVTGYLEKKDFQDGQEVHEGDVLYEIDDRPYKTTLNQAESTVAQGVAHRARLEADYRRAANLFQRAAIGKQEFDLVSSNFAEAEAQLAASRAQLEVARLNMGFTKVRAPMSGQLSRTLVNPGNLIKQDDTILNDIVSADKLYVYFDLNEEAMQKVRGLIDQGLVETGPGKEVVVHVGLSDDDVFPYKGAVNFSENKLDAATGTLRVRGIIDNPRPWILSPGLFVRVRLPIGASHQGVLVKPEAISSDQGRNFVYVVDQGDQVVYRPVVTGVIHKGLREIKEGLKAGEQLIGDANGIQRVRPGSKVEARVAPTKADPSKASPKAA